jgi:oligopeptide/dipeptide ABC transporter ATP-binding protein
MYAGEIVEQADTETLFRDPRHPYTKGLIASIPVLGELREELAVIPGSVPNLIDLPPACRFAPRCVSRVEESVELSTERHPDLLQAAPSHDVRCWMYHDAEGRLIRTDAPPSFRPGASSISGSVAIDERGDVDVLGGVQHEEPAHHDDLIHHRDSSPESAE